MKAVRAISRHRFSLVDVILIGASVEISRDHGLLWGIAFLVPLTLAAEFAAHRAGVRS